MIELAGITWGHPRGLAPMQATALEFERDHPNIRISWTTRSLQAFGEQSIVQLAESFDLLVIDHPFAGMAARSGCLLPLDEYLPASFLTDQEAQSVGPSHHSYGYLEHQWALAIDAAAQVSAYRPDLLAQRDLVAPRSWDEVFTLASKVPIAIPLDPTGSICSFLTLCANLGEPAGRQDDYLVSHATARKALDILRGLIEIAHPASLDTFPPLILDLMSTSDEIAYCPLLFGYSNYARPGFAPQLCRFTNIPTPSKDMPPRGAILGGAGLAISSRCRAIDEACQYAQFVAAPNCQRTTYVTSGGQPGNRVAWTDPQVNAATSNFFLDTLDTLDQAYLRPRYDGFVFFHDMAGLVINDYLRHKRSVGATLERLEILYRQSRKA